ncbi:iron ABC transporter permease [Thalassobium sp. R2A62]|uniref:ABC transporter permease n=1 Tax=Thalassobium sp. R2A62 TaxID=633131 RepID=UPI0001B1CBA1|nr:iron ABC transporter permease [Thalassobium sp. R2A62]EET46399.1 binding-protein-dependent transport systems inner membrane component [Thalassobium sp. R2A62]
MSEQTSQILPKNRRRLRLDRWGLGAIIIAMIVLLPIVSVIWIAANPETNVWPHLVSTTLPRYLRNTIVLMLGVGGLTIVVGVGTAWLVSMYRFPMVRWLEWALLLPLAIPAYVGAYALVDFLEYAGPVQTLLRDLFGWENARAYWFPQVRTRTMATLVIAASLYPYVYLMARAAFREQSGAAYEVAQALGVGPWRRFFKVGLPLARPAIAAGVAVVMMETVNDFGTVDYFAVQTLTTGIFSLWDESRNAAGAAQIACLVLTLVVVLVVLEQVGRARSRYFGAARSVRPIVRPRIIGVRGWIAGGLCLMPFLLGFVLPTSVLLSHALDAPEVWISQGLLSALGTSVLVGGVAAVVTVLGGVFMVYGVRLSGRRLPQLLMPATLIGYAVPGAVLGIGVLIPMAAFDNALADAIVAITGFEVGLIMTGSIGALVIAYFVRFFAIAQGTADAAIGRVTPSLPMAARSLGRTAGGTLAAVYAPLIRTSVASALLLVFVDCIKELPATLLLKPTYVDTLATRVHYQASLEDIAQAAPPALLIVVVGLVAVGLLARANR